MSSDSGAAVLLLRLCLAVHAVASLGYWIAQPRGFELLSRSFLEHQVVAPILFAVSAAGLAAEALKRRRTVWIAVGILAGFWISSSAVIAVAGSTAPSRVFWPALPASGGLLFMAYRSARPDPPALLTGGTVAGVVLAGLFWFATWAPPATTRPQPVRQPLAATGLETDRLEADGIRVSVIHAAVEIRSGNSRATLLPGFEYDSVSDSGIWTIFDFRSIDRPLWTSRRTSDQSLALAAENEDFRSTGEVRIQNRSVHVRCETLVKREIASHLSSVMQLHLPGDATAVEGIPWRLDHRNDRTEFVAFRNGRLEFLRASSREKGPFETLGSWEIRDPQLTIDGWKVQVLGWADQGSRAPSPTAGWGVSQAAIERADNVTMWSLASTSIGRGWHSVRTAPGVYVLEAVLTPP